MRVAEVTAQRYYIRFGKIPEGDRSRVGAYPNWLSQRREDDMEAGVSVYRAEWSDKKKRWAIYDVGNPSSLDELLSQKRKAWLVTGTELEDDGVDGEPLLSEVQALKELAYSEFYYVGWEDGPYPEEYLELDDD